jgi:glycosyltransferase involved in cell wall biosynthesis
MKILMGLYNAEKFVERSILSVKNQSFTDWTCYITHDLSTDRSPDIINQAIKDDSRFVLMPNNSKKLYQAGNFDTSIRNNPDVGDDEVMIEVDGDDYLPDSKVFERINNIYSDKDVWIANGSFIYQSGQMGFAQPQTNFENLRTGRFTASHIRTWRAFLWRAIKEEDLKDENGNYWQWSGDVCFMFPMLEMAGEKHYRFMYEINYIYNDFNPINEHKVDLNMVNNHASRIRAKPKYKLLERGI